MPCLTIIMAIAASKISATLEKKETPFSPISLIIRLSFSNINQAKSMFIIKDAEKTIIPYSFKITTAVIKSIGPAISGVAIGKIPQKWKCFFCCKSMIVLSFSKRITFIKNNNIPPEILKSNAVTPIRRKIPKLIREMVMVIINEYRRACPDTLFFCLWLNLSVRLKKG